MDHSHYDDAYIKTILSEVKTVALVGASPKPERASNSVMRFLLAKGYKVIPVNPGQVGRKILDQDVIGSLAEIDQPIDMVDIFRNSAAAFGVVEEALALTPLPKVIWMQLEIINQEAAEIAEAKGVKIVMDRCPAIEHPRLF